MSETCNIYCDESCHHEKDGKPAMVMGAVWCPLDKTREIAVRVREIKRMIDQSLRGQILNLEMKDF